MKLRIVSVLLAWVLLIGCAPAVTPSQTASKDSPTSLLPVTSTATVIVPTATSISPTTTRENSGTLNCFEVLNKAPDDILGYGVVVLENRKYDAIGRGIPGFFLLNLETGGRRDLDNSNERFGDAFISPDQTMVSLEKVAFDETGKIEKDQLLILTADGNILEVLPWEDGAVSGAVWLDNQNLVFDISGLDPEENRGVKPSTLLVLNPFTGERKVLKPNFPDMYDTYPLPYWGEPWGRSLSVYNQALSRVVYLSEGGYTYVLWDVQQKKEIARFVHWNISGPEIPRWSPDGLRLVMSAYRGDMSLWPQPADGVYVIDIDGNITQIMSNIGDGFIVDHVWSPSGRYIALLQSVINPDIQQKRLLIFDTQTSQIVDTCIEYHSLIVNDILVWSPDETQILLYDNTKENSKVILVHLTERVAFTIAEDMEPKGWMKSP